MVITLTPDRKNSKDVKYNYLKRTAIIAAIVVPTTIMLLRYDKKAPEEILSVGQLCYPLETLDEAYRNGQQYEDTRLEIPIRPTDPLPAQWQPEDPKCVTIFDLSRVKEAGETHEAQKLKKEGKITIRK